MSKDLTGNQKGYAVALTLGTAAALAGMLFLLSWIAHTYGTETKPAVKPRPGVVAKAPATTGDFDPSKPAFWLAFVPSLGLCFLPPWIAAVVGASIGLLYGLEAGLLASYDLGEPLHWLAWIADLTWSLPNTIFGFSIGNPLYFIMGSISRDLSMNKTWIAFSGNLPGGALQTLGPVNLGGAGKHELVHLVQARVLGPIYLPLQLISYVINSLIQVLWTILIGWILLVTGVRDSAWFRPASDSAVRTKSGKSGPADFFGWIYRYSVMELWAYATE
ncbi:MAG: hypothetical protein JO332_06690 [Planctomycetaceae bacterium]|nr:hypothetical protein [Planctomycetaceae bacterium]